jgi:hypothetical protein
MFFRQVSNTTLNCPISLLAQTLKHGDTRDTRFDLIEMISDSPIQRNM